MSIFGKHIVITGGTSGIGLELVKQLYNGNKITVIGRPSPRLQDLSAQFERLTIIEADLSDQQAVEMAADQLIKSGKRIDVLINNAAVQFTPHFLSDDFRYETIRREIDVNLTSICTLIYLLMPSLLQKEPTLILNINSGLGLVPKTSSAIYCATKGGLNLFSQSLRHQLEDTNIDVKQAFLPLVDTAMTQGRGGGSGKISPQEAAAAIIRGMAKKGAIIDIGKVKLLRLIQRLSPSLAQRIMKAS